MHCTRLLQALSHPQPAVTPAELAMCLGLTQRQQFYPMLSMSPLKPTKQPSSCPQRATSHPTHLSTSSSSTLPLSRAPSKLRSCLRRNASGLNRKRVVFADTKGLALTAVHLFTPDLSSLSPPQPETQLSASHKLLCHKFQVGFPQPITDFKSFLARPQEQHIQLESCSISENILSGIVFVSHFITKKAVYLRVTFDCWRSYQDIPCTFLHNQRCNGLEVGAYAFDFSIPPKVDPNDFGFSLWAGPASSPHADDNRGRNYRICINKDESSVGQGNINRFYPALSKPRPPARMQASSCRSADLQYFQRGFSSGFSAGQMHN
ncbi:protein phosphatase 1 regulatory subunit 3B [Cololabis saira]|uniref:protein phosphatase 1 regulatory subunit 3B n=1 Tax=Cololabis saira TaxID=129043 RepID=UPI002AD46557|nr:protein phosphatase 1 regulatory subunit 3B [Cololabis saira]